MRTAMGVAIAGLLAACGGSDESAVDRLPDEAEMAPPTVEFLASVRVTGVVMVGENLTEFLPCGEGPELWLNGPLALDLLDLHAEMTPGVEPFEGMFIDAVADIGPPPATGAGVAYPGALIVEHLRRAAYEGWNCGDIRSEIHLEASGTEPFWTLAVTEAGATFTTPDGGARPVELGELRMVPEGWAISGTEGERPVEVRLEDLGCRNAMSGAYSHLTATVTIGGTELRGCGWFGEALDPHAA